MITPWPWIVTAVALAMTAACSADNDSGGERATVPPAAEARVTDPRPPDEPAPTTGTSTPPQVRSDGAVTMATEPLGFGSGVYDVPAPASRAQGVNLGDSTPAPAYADLDELIDLGVAAGVWTEPEAVRVLLSILFGEFDPSRIPALERLTKAYLDDVIERGIALVDDPSVDAAERADLARLTAFWTADDLLGPAPRGLRTPASSGACASRVDEQSVFSAAMTTTVYCRYSDGVDDLLMPADTVLDPVHQYDLIDRVRTGYEQISGVKVPPMVILFSTAPDPSPRPGSASTLGLVAGGNADRCRMAIFQPELVHHSNLEVDFTIAHEMWHCIQKTWSGRADDLTAEGGAEYFAYQVLDRQCDGTFPGASLDANTVAGSLLDTDYDGWFFWAYLVERRGVTPSQLAAMHEAIFGGVAVPAAVGAAVGDLAPVLNEFYVRLMGPGLACGFQGSHVTATWAVDDVDRLDLEATLWEGRRYALDYASSTAFEQVDGGGGPIGMVEWTDRGDAGSWVVTEPSIRTTCDAGELWVAVATAAGDMTENHVLDVRRADDGACDPCVVGDWAVDLDRLEQYLSRFSRAEIVLDGRYDITFTPGPTAGSQQVSSTREWLMSFPAAGAAPPVVISGGGTGSYDANGTTMTISGYEQTVTATVEVPQFPVSASDTSLTDGSYPYVCEGDELSVQSGDLPLVATRAPATARGEPYFG